MFLNLVGLHFIGMILGVILLWRLGQCVEEVNSNNSGKITGEIYISILLLNIFNPVTNSWNLP
jgi:hypothetical protein